MDESIRDERMKEITYIIDEFRKTMSTYNVDVLTDINDRGKRKGKIKIDVDI